MPKINQSIEKEVVNENGEVLSTSSNKTLSWGNEPTFIKLYLDDIIYLKDLPKTHGPILYELLKHMSYAADEGQMIYINAAMKKQIAKNTGFKIGTINNAITALVKGDIFKRIDTGAYQVNPFLFGKGEWQDIAKLRLEISYDVSGKTFKTTCEYKSEKKNKQQTKHIRPAV